MEFSRCARDGARRKTHAPRDGLSKLNSVWDVEVDVLPGELEHRTTAASSRHRRAERLPE
jgi:hypothetical protein